MLCGEAHVAVTWFDARVIEEIVQLAAGAGITDVGPPPITAMPQPFLKSIAEESVSVEEPEADRASRCRAGHRRSSASAGRHEGKSRRGKESARQSAGFAPQRLSALVDGTGAPPTVSEPVTAVEPLTVRLPVSESENAEIPLVVVTVVNVGELGSLGKITFGNCIVVIPGHVDFNHVPARRGVETVVSQPGSRKRIGQRLRHGQIGKDGRKRANTAAPSRTPCRCARSRPPSDVPAR